MVLEVLGIRERHLFLVVLGFQPLRGLLEILGGRVYRVVLVGKACMVVGWLARRGQSAACLVLRGFLVLLAFRVCLAFLEVLGLRAVLEDSIHRKMELG